jgi:hypothetical protein
VALTLFELHDPLNRVLLLAKPEILCAIPGVREGIHYPL